MFVLRKNALFPAASEYWPAITLEKAFVLKREFAENSRLVTGVPAL
jgi:hypothetical protein